MFFVLSKVLYFLIQPLNWIVLLLLFAFFTKQPKRRKRFLGIGIVLLLIFTNHMLFNTIIRWWEMDTITADQIEEPYDIGIVLGGFTSFNLLPSHDRYNFNRSANRLTQALELYHSGKIKKILLTGGSGNMLEPDKREATHTRDYLLRTGIPDSVLLIESASRNTHENALLSKSLLAEHPNARCLLITSAWHMPRASASFRKLNIAHTPYSVDFMGEAYRFTPGYIFFPNRDDLGRWEILIKEWVGYWAYRLRGYL